MNDTLICAQDSTALRTHPAAPLTDATRPYYERMEALRVEGWTSNLQTRYEIAELTQAIWRATRNGHQKRD